MRCEALLPATDGLPPLSIRGGRVTIGGTEVLRDVDVQVRRGEFVALLGANGSGKTSLVKAMLGLVPVTAGAVELFGIPLASFRNRELIGYVPQRVTATSGVPASVFEVVLSGRVPRTKLLGGYRRADRAAAEEALRAIDLTHASRAPVATLSGGQQQRVLIARALAGEPEVLVLDEPVASVDLAHQGSFAQTLGELNRAGTTIVLVAHSLGAMAPLVDRSVVLEHGRVIYDGRPLEEPAQHVHHHHDHPHHEPERRQRM